MSTLDYGLYHRYLLRCSEIGERIAQHYLQQETSRREQAEQQVLAALRARQVEQAVRRMVTFELGRVFPFGIESALSANEILTQLDPARYVAVLQRLLHSAPPRAARFTVAQLNHVRVAAAMCYLWGRESPAGWLPRTIEEARRKMVQASLALIREQQLDVANLLDRGGMSMHRREAADLRVGTLSSNGEPLATVHYVFLDPHDPPVTGEFIMVEDDLKLETAEVYQLHLAGGGQVDVEVTGVIKKCYPNGEGERVLMYLMARLSPFPQ